MMQEDEQRYYELAEKLLAEQNFTAAAVGGAAAMVLAAIGYGLATVMAGFTYGFAAAGIGIAVGLAMLYLGRGIETKFAILASVYTIAGCVLGGVVRAIVELSRQNFTSPLDVVRSHSPAVLIERAASYISFADLVFWFVAVFAAVFLAKRALSRSDRLALGLYAKRKKSRSLP